MPILPAAIPASAPVSPIITRSGNADRGHSAPPVTPQRLARRASSKYIQNQSPVTPYTPLSSRSYCSSNASTLNTPGSVSSIKRLSFSVSSSPDIRGKTTKEKSLADIAENWRSRANENGIKVSNGEDAHYAADDEASATSDRTLSDLTTTEFPEGDEALLPPPFLSTHRRPRSYSQAAPPCTPHSPQILCTPVRRAPLSPHALRTVASINTPPPKPNRMQELKLKGSLTDPAQTRRRPVFGQTTTDLFDIDENDFAYPQSFNHSSASASITYPHSFGSLASPYNPITLNDPFSGAPLSTIEESAHQYLHELSLHSRSYSKALQLPTPSTHPLHSHSLHLPFQPEPRVTDPNSCSVCGRTSSLAILEPCLHPLCSACLTSALNIVGEKDMECAVCKKGVKDFRLGLVVGKPAKENQAKGEAKEDLLLNTFGGSGKWSHNANRLGFNTSTPVRQGTPRHGENVVLRIDNVPWDITPPLITAWLKQPIAHVHVLLDRKGKTLSHAFVELAGDDEDMAKAALRGAQNSVLGTGRRARGVTVTRSGGEEVMCALFPSWKGNFDGMRPSLAGLDNERVIATLETGLLTEVELAALLSLIKSPDSHFVKVPSLPFYSLVSILSKFPADVDSRVFWSGALRDMLYDVTFAAVQVLLERMQEPNRTVDPELLLQVVRAGMECQAFTTQQTTKLATLIPQASPSPSASPSPGTRENGHRHAAHEQLAREFGVEAQLVEALVQRLEGLN